MPRKANPKTEQPTSWQDRLTGTSGAFLTELPADIEFKAPGRISPYDKLLMQLEKAHNEPRPPGAQRPGLVFDHVKAQTAVVARAKKLGYRVLFAEKAGKLYVQFAGLLADDPKLKRREAILAVLAKAPAPLKYIEITNRLRAGGDELLEAAAVDAILVQMMRAGDVLRVDGGAWRISLKKVNGSIAPSSSSAQLPVR